MTRSLAARREVAACPVDQRQLLVLTGRPHVGLDGESAW